MATLQELLNTGNYFTDKGRFHGSDKYFGREGKVGLHNYIKTYERMFSPFKDKDINFLEIGIFFGGSMKLWRDYFTKANIYGFDIIYTPLAKETLKNKNVTIRLCDSRDSNSEILKNIDENTFDFIIDDGNHSFNAQFQTLVNYFPTLKIGGTYIIEDIEDRTMKNSNMINKFKSFKEFEIVDLRKQDNRKDSVLFIFKK